MNKKLILFTLVAAILLAGCSPSFLIKDKDRIYVAKEVDQYLHNMYLAGSSWSILAVDLEDGKVILDRDSERTLIPASNMKLLTTAAALDLLGPDYRFETNIGYIGQIDSMGILHGDLVIVGAGDPTIGTRYGREDSVKDPVQEEIFENWAVKLKELGIHSVDGNLVGYSTWRPGDHYGSGWEWNDLKHWYAAEIDPFIYSDGCIEFTITPGDSAGEKASVHWSPEYDDLSVHAQIITSEAGGKPKIQFERKLTNNIITIWGTIPADDEFHKLWISVYDIERFYLNSLQSALMSNGISHNGDIVTGKTQPGEVKKVHRLFIHQSAPLSEILKTINQDSQNLYAEALLRTLGQETMEAGKNPLSGENDPSKVGQAVVREWEDTLAGISPGFSMVDGSGMSRRNLMSAASVMRILAYMNRSKYRKDFTLSMATPGVGSMKYRLVGLPAGLTVFAKSGSMSHVRALSGYISDAQGPLVAFSIICNNYLGDSAEVDATIDNICQLLALYTQESR